MLESRRPHLIYWLGHATPDYLRLGADKVTIRELHNCLSRSRSGDAEKPGGLIFLNACQTALCAESERALGSFLQTFHDNGFSGIIATEEKTLDTLANPFGLDVLTGFLDRREPIGELVRRLRVRHAPLGLLYGTYCPPNVRVAAAPGAGRERGEPPHRVSAPERALSARRPAPTPKATDGPGSSEAPVMDMNVDAPELSAGSGSQPYLEGKTKAWPALPGAPYLPLEPYGPEHRALFAGRDADVFRFCGLLASPETRLLVLQGASGVGKSSFLNAGVGPYLDEVAVGYRFEGRGGFLCARATDDPVGQVAQRLVVFSAEPFVSKTPDGSTTRVDMSALLTESLGLAGEPTAPSVRDALLADPANLDRALGALASGLPFTLVLVVDQAEEVFTLVGHDELD
jgi:hypothetical protein